MNCSKLIIILLLSLAFTSCKNSKDLNPNRPLSGEEKRKKNVREGGSALSNILDRGSTNYEFSTSNPMWRASLETLDFLPLTTVDYSGGIIITDWYSEGGNNEAVKLTIRFLSNEIRSDSLKIIIHKKVCDSKSNCQTVISDSSLIKNELRSTILNKAALLEKSDKEKK
jgi:hypothetical protein